MKKNDTVTIKNESVGRLVWVLVVCVLVFSWANELSPFVNNFALKGRFEFTDRNLSENETENVDKVEYWKKILDKQPGYHRAYLELAVLAAEAGDITNSKIYLESAIAIDPNNAENKQVEKFVESSELFLRK